MDIIWPHRYSYQKGKRLRIAFLADILLYILGEVSHVTHRHITPRLYCGSPGRKLYQYTILYQEARQIVTQLLQYSTLRKPSLTDIYSHP